MHGARRLRRRRARLDSAQARRESARPTPCSPRVRVGRRRSASRRGRDARALRPHSARLPRPKIARSIRCASPSTARRYATSAALGSAHADRARSQSAMHVVRCPRIRAVQQSFSCVHVFNEEPHAPAAARREREAWSTRSSSHQKCYAPGPGARGHALWSGATVRYAAFALPHCMERARSAARHQHRARRASYDALRDARVGGRLVGVFADDH